MQPEIAIKADMQRAKRRGLPTWILPIDRLAAAPLRGGLALRRILQQYLCVSMAGDGSHGLLKPLGFDFGESLAEGEEVVKRGLRLPLIKRLEVQRKPKNCQLFQKQLLNTDTCAPPNVQTQKRPDKRLEYRLSWMRGVYWRLQGPEASCAFQQEPSSMTSRRSKCWKL